MIGNETPSDIEIISKTDKGTAWSAGVTEEGKVGHTVGNYKIVEDKLDEHGRRILVLEPVDDAELSRKRAAIIKIILQKLGESRSRVTRGLLKDVFHDYYPETIQRLYEKIVEKAMPIKEAEGCYKIKVGDGRTKDWEEIMLRE